jgi:hypothetical protein
MKKNTASQLGFWASVVYAVLGGGFFLVLIYHYATEGFSNPTEPSVQLFNGIVTLIAMPLLVIIFTAIRFVNEEDNQVLGSLAVSFTILFAATVSINRFVQITVIYQSLPDVPPDLIRFLPYDPGSVMNALEILGWGFFSTLAALFVAPLFSSSRLNMTIRWFFILYAIFSFMGLIGYATNSPIAASGFIAWGLIILVLSILLSFYFRKVDKAIT